MNWQEVFYINGRAVAKRFKPDWLEKNEYLKHIIEETSFLDLACNLNLRIYCLLNNIYEQPYCKTCKKLMTSLTSERKYPNYCSTSCSAKNRAPEAYTKRDQVKAKEKRSATMLAKYGVEYNSQRTEVKDILSKNVTNRYLSEDTRDKLANKEWLFTEYVTNKRTATDIAFELKCDYSTVLAYCRDYGFHIRQQSNYSLNEKKIVTFLSKYVSPEDIWVGDQTVIKPLELDIYLPEYKLAIEHDGLRYHSFISPTKENKEYHLKKTKLCEELGIQLLHVFEDEWNFKEEIVKSIILSKLGIFEKRIYARQCEIKQITSKEARAFAENNHLQGFVGGTHYALIYENEIVSLLTLGAFRFNKEEKCRELLRFCSKLNWQVIGGFQRLFKYVDENLLTFADLRYSTGKLYEENGEYLGQSGPGYYWVDPAAVYKKTRFACQRKKLPTLLGNKFDPSLSEAKNMLAAGWTIIYDCGNRKYLLRKRV